MSFTIKELASLSGIKPHTIRIWEQRYNFLKPSRTQTNIRTYNNEELKTLLTVALLNKYGYKISRIDEMLPEQRANAILKLPNQEAYKESIINDLVGYMIDVNSTAFEEALDHCVQQYGIEKTLTAIIFGFLEKVGILWQTNKIIPMHEHIVSNIIRQKIVRAIEDLPLVRNAKPLFVLLLPENEHHELGLLFVYYLLRKKGIQVIYLGANVPFKDISYLVQIKSPQYLYLHLTSFPRQQSFQKYISQLSSQFTMGQVLVSGAVVQNQKFSLPANVHFLSSIREVITYISTTAL